MFLPEDKPALAFACSLTKRELEILWLFSKGMKNKDVCRARNISYHTVRKHRANIFKKLNANGKYVAIEIAKQNNWWGYAEALNRM